MPTTFLVAQLGMRVPTNIFDEMANYWYRQKHRAYLPAKPVRLNLFH